MNRRFKNFGTGLAFSIALMFFSALSSPAVFASSSVTSKVSTSSKVVALTFDDCYSSTNANAILAILKANGIKATFFIIGDAAAKHPSIVSAINDAGMEIGNHTYNHTNLTRLTYSQIQSELSRTDDVIRGITGKTTKPLFRPPYGYYNSSVLQAAGDAGYTRAIMWTIESLDYTGISSSEIYSRVVNNVTPGAIVLMHAVDTAPNTKYALQDIINNLRNQGYSFKTVSGLLEATSSATSNVAVSSTSSGSILRQGSTGNAVKQLQQALVNKGYSLSVDGVFGTMTQNALISFQRSVGITADGIVGPVTWSKLGTSSGSSSSVNSSSYPGILRQGSSGTAVRQLQQALVNKGYNITVDGVFGPKTKSTVMSFQSSKGITVDGIVGSVTWGRLF
jgi:polysaccharide deacetylase family sporulation protein PdaB